MAKKIKSSGKKSRVSFTNIKDNIEDETNKSVGLDKKTQEKSKKKKREVEKDTTYRRGDNAETRVEKRNVRRMQRNGERAISIFQNEYEELRSMIGSEANDFQNEKANLSMLRSLLSMTIEVIGEAEKQYYKYRSQSNAYALVSLVSQARELANDIRTLQDSSQQVDHIVNNIIATHMRMIINNMITEKFEIEKMVESYITNNKTKQSFKKRLDRMLKNHGHYISESIRGMDNKIREYML